MDVKKYLPQKTPIGFVMKESAEGYYVMVEDFDRVTAERDALQQLLNARDEEVDRLRSAGKEMLRIAAIANQGSAAYNRAIINLHQTLENQA
jgi:hypothetical protein